MIQKVTNPDSYPLDLQNEKLVSFVKTRQTEKENG